MKEGFNLWSLDLLPRWSFFRLVAESSVSYVLVRRFGSRILCLGEPSQSTAATYGSTTVEGGVWSQTSQTSFAFHNVAPNYAAVRD